MYCNALHCTALYCTVRRTGHLGPGRGVAAGDDEAEAAFGGELENEAKRSEEK